MILSFKPRHSWLRKKLSIHRVIPCIWSLMHISVDWSFVAEVAIRGYLEKTSSGPDSVYKERFSSFFPISISLGVAPLCPNSPRMVFSVFQYLFRRCLWQKSEQEPGSGHMRLCRLLVLWVNRFLVQPDARSANCQDYVEERIGTKEAPANG